MTKPITIRDAGRVLGLSRARVLQLDAKLAPRRTETGTRVYDANRLDELTGFRAVTGARR